MTIEKIFYADIEYRPPTDWNNPKMIQDTTVAENEEEARTNFETDYYRNATIKRVYAK